MDTYNFQVRINRPPDDDEIDALYEAGLSDAGIGGDIIDFDREAPTLAEAVASAVEDIAKVPGLHAVGLEQFDEVTLADAAQRLGGSRTAESLRLLATGERGPGGFPAPLSDTGKIRIYSWAQILAFLVSIGDQGAMAVDRGKGHDQEVLALFSRQLRLGHDTAHLAEADPASADVLRGAVWGGLLQPPRRQTTEERHREMRERAQHWAAWLNERLAERNMTVRGLKDASGGVLDSATISMWRSGNTVPSETTALRVASALFAPAAEALAAAGYIEMAQLIEENTQETVRAPIVARIRQSGLSEAAKREAERFVQAEEDRAAERIDEYVRLLRRGEQLDLEESSRTGQADTA